MYILKALKTLISRGRTDRPQAHAQGEQVATATEPCVPGPIIVRAVKAAPTTVPARPGSARQAIPPPRTVPRQKTAQEPQQARPSKAELSLAAETEALPAIALLLPHFLAASRQLRVSLAELLAAELKRQGRVFSTSVLRSFEGGYLCKLCLAECMLVAEARSEELAKLKTAISSLPILLADQAFVHNALLNLEKEKPSLQNLLLYHLLLTGLLPLLRVKRVPPGMYEVEFRMHKVGAGALLRGVLLGNWTSENLQDAYQRASRDALIRLIAAKGPLEPSRQALIACFAGKSANVQRRAH